MIEQSNKHSAPQPETTPGYRVRVKGCLSEDLIVWLDLPIQTDPVRGVTCLWVSSDQSALYGALLRLRDLGLTLLSVEQVPPETIS